MGIKFLDRTTGEIKFFNEETIDSFMDITKTEEFINSTSGKRNDIASVILNRVKIDFFMIRTTLYMGLSVNISNDSITEDGWIVDENANHMNLYILNRDYKKVDIVGAIMRTLIEIKKYSTFSTRGEHENIRCSYRDLFEKENIDISRTPITSGITSGRRHNFEYEPFYTSLWDTVEPNIRDAWTTISSNAYDSCGSESNSASIHECLSNVFNSTAINEDTIRGRRISF